MEPSRRRQHHSCDQCRKGKRACDSPIIRDSGFSSCSNCKRWKKRCTFDWLSLKKTEPKKHRRTKEARSTSSPQEHDEVTSLPQENLDNLRAGITPTEPSDLPLPWPLTQTGAVAELLLGSDPDGDQFGISAQNPNTLDTLQSNGGIQDFGESLWRLDDKQSLSNLLPACWSNATEMCQILEEHSPGLKESHPSSAGSPEILDRNNGLFQSPSEPKQAYMPRSSNQIDFRILSDKTADKYVRLTMTQNLIRIYHDSMENALSCWLTERNCPYSNLASHLLSGERNEWGPNWTNRIYDRVCQLDRASSSLRSRSLSITENMTAARVLHVSIMAFASQWAQHSQEPSDDSLLAPIAPSERSMRETLWNQARHALEKAAGIPSFRIIFANILFFFTQRPLDNRQDIELNELLDNDCAPLFLEKALRQLVTFRYKVTRLQRTLENRNTPARDLTQGRLVDRSDVQYAGETPPEPPRANPILVSYESSHTFNLLFWLGVMLDTQAAVMYQRPLVISDSDSQITSVSPRMFHMAADDESRVDLDGWNIQPNGTPPETRDLWGDLFLHRSAAAAHQGFDTNVPGWPYSYKEAAEILSDAAPVKVLLFRRITKLQTLVYRGAGPECLEEVVQNSLLVYRHWNSTYRRFILDCMDNHSQLPPRIQSWYVVLAAHWHLGGMLLADGIESIDRARISSDSHRESRESMDLISALRRDNAAGIAALAQCSLHSQESVIQRRPGFHDSLNETAFLTEPFTVLLIHAFTKAGYILIDNMCLSQRFVHCKLDGSFEQLRQNCEFCIRSLWCLGKHSDMASLMARNLSRNLDSKLQQHWRGYPATYPEHFRGNRGLSSAFDSVYGLSDARLRMDDYSCP
ncbi:hypothetical protein ARAM_005065 [Aspergillus rambellii]|uniref:Zn(2)-C6 fungal-type domain-containing protein n=1 Tax=Aspergillus rambellii TaxID=308745 RepID=A0A0F8UQV4_9EURO|nr:hypothetical protein ARAM_005065 [Aspergillus rambellii]